MADRVMVTGATGFVGQHLVLRLLQQGYVVRAAVRDREGAQALRDILQRIAPDATTLEIAIIDLEDDAGWVEAMHGVNFVHHLASPLPVKLPRDMDALVAPARDGALRVLNAARNEIGMKRVIMTSSSAAVAFGWRHYRPSPLDERHWTDPDYLPGNTPHSRAATIAERAAWDWVRSEGEGLSLTTILPGVVLGPLMTPRMPASATLLVNLMQTRCRHVPPLGVIVADVRDVADAHMAAMNAPKAHGRRFLVGSDFMTLQQMSRVIADIYPEHAARLIKGTMPVFLMRAAMHIWPGLRHFRPEFAKERTISTERLQNDLGIRPRPARETIELAARSLVDQGLVRLPR